MRVVIAGLIAAMGLSLVGCATQKPDEAKICLDCHYNPTDCDACTELRPCTGRDHLSAVRALGGNFRHQCLDKYSNPTTYHANWVDYQYPSGNTWLEFDCVVYFSADPINVDKLKQRL